MRCSATHWRSEGKLSYTLKVRGDARLHTEGRRRCSATRWRPEEMLGYTLKAGWDAQLHTEGRRRCSATHWRSEEKLSYNTECRRRCSATHWRLEEMVSGALKAGGDGRLHTTQLRVTNWMQLVCPQNKTDCCGVNSGFLIVFQWS